MTAGNGPVSPTMGLLVDYYSNMAIAYRSMRKAFALREECSGLTKSAIADALRVDKSVITRRLSGEENLTLKSLSFMASAMSCRLVVTFTPDEEVSGHNHPMPDLLHSIADSRSATFGISNNHLILQAWPDKTPVPTSL